MAPGPRKSGGAAPPRREPESALPVPQSGASEETALPLDGPAIAGRMLEGGRWTTLVTAAGSGFARLGDAALTRWRGDRVTDEDGWALYLRDLDDGAYWSLGHQPCQQPPDRYTAFARPGVVTIVRRDRGLEARLEVGVLPEGNGELRRVTLRDLTGRARRIEITSCLEVVLQDAAADRSHPAFSKLFVQTERAVDPFALLARRRPRSPGERYPWLAHGIAGGRASEIETDRARFLGRGGSRAHPAALAAGARLSGTTGNVLDPVLALRETLTVAANGFASLTFVLAAGDDREAALLPLRLLSVPLSVEAAFARAEDRAQAELAAQGRTEEQEDRDQAARVAALYRTPPITTAILAPLATLPPRPAEADGRSGAPDGVADGRTTTAPSAVPEPLRSFNGYGGFSEDGTEYVIRLTRQPDGSLRRPPAPWTNVIANERVGCLVSETGAASTWGANSRERRITPWTNDPVLDPHEEAVYVRDHGTGRFWSPTPGPAPGAGDYETRHGFGVTTFRHVGEGLGHETTMYVDREHPVRIVHVRLRNLGSRTRRLSVVSYQRLVLGGVPEETAAAITTEFRVEAGALLARTGEPDAPVAFAAVLAPGGFRGYHVSGDRECFLGRYGTLECPRALAAQTLDDRTGSGFDPCFAQQAVIEIGPGEDAECAFLLGEAASDQEVSALIARFRRPGALAESLAEVRRFWRELLGAVQVETPVPALDLMVNGWLLYQTLACRIQGRTAFYQSGGAFGFRDQLQDASAFLLTDPGRTRAQILLHAAHQFVEGDVLHWWHPPGGRGLRTRFADDLLWLPLVTGWYLRATGERAVLDEVVPFRVARALAPGEDEAFLETAPSIQSADLYQHCVRAIDRSLATGVHGLPLFGTGDWNDGMNRVGREGRGESVWMGFFLSMVLGDWIELCASRGDVARASRYRDHRDALAAALEQDGWDGDWYRRGYYDDGTPLGTAGGDECRIDALVQAWSVLAGVTSPERAARAMDAVERHLVMRDPGLVRLLTPAFDTTPHDPGYIKGYLPGVRENGGQYTHAALWVARALAELGRHERAAEVLEMLSPVTHGSSLRIERYRVEPYVVCADVYGEPPHVGRGGWTWYTGSAGWMQRVVVETLLGIEIRGGTTLVVTPRAPADWTRYRVQVQRFGASWDIEVRTPTGDASRIVSATLDGAPVPFVDPSVEIPIGIGRETHKIVIERG
jgi:cyclic beta-1,2-glucan synthetase